jgi:hypothetical protein
MTTFFDRTEAVLHWCCQERVPPVEACEILRRRLDQVRAYLAWVGKQSGDSFEDPQETEAVLRWDSLRRDWRRFCELAANLGVLPAEKPFWRTVEAVLERCEDLPGYNLYFQSIWPFLFKPFRILHAACHGLNGVPDDPHPGSAGDSAEIPDADRWMAEHYPDAPSDVAPSRSREWF